MADRVIIPRMASGGACPHCGYPAMETVRYMGLPYWRCPRCAHSFEPASITEWEVTRSNEAYPLEVSFGAANDNAESH